jgi:putative nucleotidyltransferase with HDIG domain
LIVERKLMRGISRGFAGVARLLGRRENPTMDPMPIDKQSRSEASPLWAHLSLPPFPQIALEVLQLVNDENVQLHQLSDLISSDPAFASEVLTVANSLLYAPQFPAASVQQAIAVLGANNLQGLCLTVGVRGYMGRALQQKAMRGLWHHSLACALIADQLASVGYMDRDIAYTMGVMHDIGRLALAVTQPKQYILPLANHKGSPASILPIEQQVFGLDHCEAGRRLMAEWNLPPEFEAIVAKHHEPRKKGAPWEMSDLIKVSCRMTDAAGFPAFPGCEVTPFADLLGELPSRERALFHTTVETLIADVNKKIDAIELS